MGKVYSTKYIVQFVGFKTVLSAGDFIRRWTPIASNFKDQGIISIDLYEVSGNSDIAYISRNVWAEETYFRNFPTGVAGSGSGGGVSVIQFGGYRLPSDSVDSLREMQLVFSHDIIQIESGNFLACLSASDKVPFRQVLLFNDAHSLKLPPNSIDIKCKHIKRL